MWLLSSNFPPSNRNVLFKKKKKNVSGILCITPAEGLYLPSGGLFFFPSAGPSERKGFQYFQIGMWGSPEEKLWGDGAKIYYFKIEKKNEGKVKSSHLQTALFVYFKLPFGLILIRV